MTLFEPKLRENEPDSFSVFVIGHCHTKGESVSAVVESGRTILFRLPPRLCRRHGLHLGNIHNLRRQIFGIFEYLSCGPQLVI